MKNATLGHKFFNRPTLQVAQELLGKYLVRKIGSYSLARQITEVEAYVGLNDRASHASRGMTPRNRVMFGSPGVWYVYFTYGMHWMLNMVTEEKNYPAAVLIRGVEGISGPARVTKFFKINKHFNTKPAARKTGLWIEDRGVQVKQKEIHRSKRIGVDYAGAWKHKLWRFSV